MSEELSQLLDELLGYFELSEEGYPTATVFVNGRFISGMVSDELHAILMAIKEAKEDEE